MGFSLKSGNNTTFKKMGCKTPYLSRTQPSPFYKDDKEKPDKPEKEEKEVVEKEEKEVIEKEKPVVEEKPLPTTVAAPEEFNFEQAISNKQEEEKVKEEEAKKEVVKKEEETPEEVEEAKDIAKSMASNIIEKKALGNTIEGVGIEAIEAGADKLGDFAENKMQNFKKVVQPKFDLNKFKTPQSRALAKKALKRVGRIGLKFIPGIGQFSLAMDLGELALHGIKNRKQIQSYLTNKAKNIQNSINEFGDPPTKVT